MISYNEIKEAHNILKSVIKNTPLENNRTFQPFAYTPNGIVHKRKNEGENKEA